MLPAHPLAAILDAAASGGFPPADGAVDVLPPDGDGTRAVVAFTGHAYVLADVAADELHDGCQIGGVAASAGRCIPTCCVGWPGMIGRSARSTSCWSAAASAVRRRRRATRDESQSTRRVLRALRHRRDVEVVVEPDGVVILGRGLVGRRELSVELFDPATPSSGPAAG